MDSPLKVFRQFKRRIGREVEVLLTNGIRHEGILKAANEQQLVLEKTIKINKKESATETLEIPFAEIKHTKLILNF
jgi:ribosome maturation factor RimP